MMELRVEWNEFSRQCTLADPIIRLGSDPKCEVALPGIPGLEGEHVKIVDTGNSGWLVMAAHSRCPMKINGEQLKQGRLQPGDQMELGPARVYFLDSSAKPAPIQPLRDLKQRLAAREEKKERQRERREKQKRLEEEKKKDQRWYRRWGRAVQSRWKSVKSRVERFQSKGKHKKVRREERESDREERREKSKNFQAWYLRLAQRWKGAEFSCDVERPKPVISLVRRYKPILSQAKKKTTQLSPLTVILVATSFLFGVGFTLWYTGGVNLSSPSTSSLVVATPVSSSTEGGEKTDSFPREEVTRNLSQLESKLVDTRKKATDKLRKLLAQYGSPVEKVLMAAVESHSDPLVRMRVQWILDAPSDSSQGDLLDQLRR